MKHAVMLLTGRAFCSRATAHLLSEILPDARVAPFPVVPKAVRALGNVEFDLIALPPLIVAEEGTAAIKPLRQAAPQTPILAFVCREAVPATPSLVAAGASGVVLVTEPESLLTDAVKATLRGETFVSEAGRRLLAPTVEDGAPHLTARQRQTLDLLKAGLSNRDIAQHLNLSESTVKAHVSAILRHYGMHRRTELLAHLGHD